MNLDEFMERVGRDANIKFNAEMRKRVEDALPPICSCLVGVAFTIADPWCQQHNKEEEHDEA